MKHTLLSLLAGPCLIAASGSAETIRVYNRAEYIDLDLISEFTEVTGIDVIYDTYSNSKTVETMLTAGGSGYDVVVVSSEYLQRLQAAGAIVPIDHQRLVTFENMWGDVMERIEFFDAHADHSIPYLWGTTGLGYDRNKVLEIMPDAPLNSWDLLLKPEIVSQFTGCGVSLTDAIEELMAITLSYLGHDPNSNDPAHITEAQETINAIMPHVTDIGTEQYNVLAKGEACVAMVWSGDALLANSIAADDVEVSYVVPKEGAPLWFDLFVIPADTEHVNAAHVFIDFILRPENIARASDFSFYANANVASMPYVSEEVISNPIIYPDADTMARVFPVLSRSPEEKRDISRAWRMMQLSN